MLDAALTICLLAERDVQVSHYHGSIEVSTPHLELFLSDSPTVRIPTGGDCTWAEKVVMSVSITRR